MGHFSNYWSWPLDYIPASVCFKWLSARQFGKVCRTSVSRLFNQNFWKSIKSNVPLLIWMRPSGIAPTMENTKSDVTCDLIYSLNMKTESTAKTVGFSLLCVIIIVCIIVAHKSQFNEMPWNWWWPKLSIKMMSYFPKGETDTERKPKGECENKLFHNLLRAIIIQHSHTFIIIIWKSAYIW